MQVLQGSKKGIRCVAFAPDGGSLAASGYDGCIRLWNLSTGEAARLGSLGTTPKSLTWTPDGERIVWVCSGSAFVLRPGDREPELIGLNANVHSICYAPDGRTLYVATEYAIRNLDLAIGKELASWRAVSPGFLAVSSDGRTLASTHPHAPFAKIDAKHVALWDTATGTRTARLLECDEFYDGVAFAPDGTRLAALGHQSLWLWEFPSGRVVTHHPSKKFYTGLAFSPDGHILATSNNDGAVRFWDGHTGAPIKALEWKIGKVLCVAFSADGTRAAAGGETGSVVVWDVD